MVHDGERDREREVHDKLFTETAAYNPNARIQLRPLMEQERRGLVPSTSPALANLIECFNHQSAYTMAMAYYVYYSMTMTMNIYELLPISQSQNAKIQASKIDSSPACPDAPKLGRAATVLDNVGIAGPLQVGWTWTLKGVVLELGGVANEKAVGCKDLHHLVPHRSIKMKQHESKWCHKLLESWSISCLSHTCKWNASTIPPYLICYP